MGGGGEGVGEGRVVRANKDNYETYQENQANQRNYDNRVYKK